MFPPYNIYYTHNAHKCQGFFAKTRKGANTKNKRIVTIRAGRLFYGIAYTQAIASDSEKVRRDKTRVSSEARKKLNFRAAWQKLELLLAANFGARDLLVTLTYDDAHLPESRPAAQAILRKYITALRKERSKQGHPLKYIYVTEHLHGDGRYHHHMVVNGTGYDYETLCALWTGGSNIEIDYINPHDYAALAQYLTKEPREAGSSNGQRSWTPSLNLDKPTRESVLVEDYVGLSAPPGATILETDGKQNSWGSYAYLKCLMLSHAVPHRTARCRRKNL